jgi:hypothetical protein
MGFVKKYAKEELLKELRRISRKISKTKITQKDFIRNSDISTRQYIWNFGSWNNAIKEAGLEFNPSALERKVATELLFQDIDRVAKNIGKIPTMDEIKVNGKYGLNTYKRRFGSWSEMVKRYKNWLNPPTAPEDGEEEVKERSHQEKREKTYEWDKIKRTEYGDPINFRGMNNAPINELGVIYLFGMVASELGFIIENMRTAFPDCEGKRKIKGKNRWEKVFIEFEYKSSNFREHCHDPKQCDLVVCWEHDWRDCPVEVLSLKDIINKL